MTQIKREGEIARFFNSAQPLCIERDALAYMRRQGIHDKISPNDNATEPCLYSIMKNGLAAILPISLLTDIAKRGCGASNLHPAGTCRKISGL
jgi:hypothetical protein